MVTISNFESYIIVLTAVLAKNNGSSMIQKDRLKSLKLPFMLTNKNIVKIIVDDVEIDPQVMEIIEKAKRCQPQELERLLKKVKDQQN